MNARYYDPSNGRFISQDSYRGSVNEPSQWHLYMYCANNPINYVDPSGHWVISIGRKYEATYIYGVYGMVSASTDGSNLLISLSAGLKFTTTVAASKSWILSLYTAKSVDGLLGWGITLGVSVIGKTTYSAGGTIDKNGNVSGGVSIVIKQKGTPAVAPFYFNFEFGKTIKLLKLKWNKD